MSKYSLTKSILANDKIKAIDIARESEFFFYKVLNDEGNEIYREAPCYLYDTSFERLCPVLNPQNIQKILLGLVLKGLSYISVTFNPKTQVKALSDKWFSLREVNGQVVSSLWDSGEEGQTQVLEEFLEVLKSIK